jgi:hypothetical protein
MLRSLRIWSVLPAGALLLGVPVFAQTPPAQPEPAPFERPLPEDGPAMAPLPPPDDGPLDDDVMFMRSFDTPAPALAPMALPSEPLTPEREKEALGFLRQESPDLAPSIEALKKSQPEVYGRELSLALRESRALSRAQQRSPGQVEDMRRERSLDRVSRDLVRRYRQATQASERTQIRTNLAAALDELFDLRERHRQEMIERLEKELQNLRQTTEKRRQSKDRIVQNRLEDLLGTDDDLRW